MAEFYIRREGDEDASGPFDMDQIISLVEVGKLDTDAYYYDIDAEDWIKIADNKEMMDTLFPQKKKLSLRGGAAAAPAVVEDSESSEQSAERKPRLKISRKEEASPAEEIEKEDGPSDIEEADQQLTGEPLSEETLPEPEPNAPIEAQDEPPQEDRRKSRRKPRLKDKEEEEKKLISVETMLAQAEGRPENDPSGKSPVEKQAQAAMIGLRMATFFVLASIVSMGYLELDLLQTADIRKIFKSPFTIAAAFDVVLGLLLILGVTEIFSLLRFRAAVGAGLFSILFLASGDPILAVSTVFISISMYFCTVIINTPRILLACLPGVLGVIGYVYVLILPQA